MGSRVMGDRVMGPNSDCLEALLLLKKTCTFEIEGAGPPLGKIHIEILRRTPVWSLHCRMARRPCGRSAEATVRAVDTEVRPAERIALGSPLSCEVSVRIVRPVVQTVSDVTGRVRDLNRLRAGDQ